MMTSIPKLIIDELQKIQKRFLWGNSNPNVKRTLSKEYKNGGLKSDDIFSKVM